MCFKCNFCVLKVYHIIERKMFIYLLKKMKQIILIRNIAELVQHCQTKNVLLYW